MAYAFREFSIEENRMEQEVAEEQKGIFIIWYKSGENWSMLDVSEMYEVRARVLARAQGPGPKECGSVSETYYTVTWTPRDCRPGRIEIEQRQWLPTGTFGKGN